jgi:hypothetical protein
VAGIGFEIAAVQSRWQALGRHHVLSGESEQLVSEIKCVRMDAGALEARLSAEWRELSLNQRKELGELQESIVRLIPGVRDGELHPSLATYRFVPGLSPLSKGAIAFMTPCSGGNVHERQCILTFSDFQCRASYGPQDAANLSIDRYAFLVTERSKLVDWICFQGQTSNIAHSLRDQLSPGLGGEFLSHEVMGD